MVTITAMYRRNFSAIFCILALSCLSAWPQVPKPKPTTGSSNRSATPAQSTPEISANDVEAFLDGLVPMQLQREDVAGAVIVVVKDGKVLVSKGYGFADVKKRIPVSPDATLFRPGSISKAFTWTAVMQLVEQGKLNLDRDINDYLDFQVPHTFGCPVTLRNLMTHTAGFEEVIKDLGADRADELPTLQRFIKSHEPHQIYSPGTIPAYSNYGADLAGYIVQRVSGLPFEQYIQQNIFGPLGMTRATFVQPLPDPLKPMMSNGYSVAS
jgi:CubicO group peptidase (beta-lactamase class C family)